VSTAGRAAEDIIEAGSLEHGTVTSDHGDAQLLAAEALLSAGDSDGTVARAREARATYLAMRQSPGAARCLLIEARALQLARDASAELLFRRALRECQALEPVPSLLEADIACELILHLGTESRWAAAQSVYNQVRSPRSATPVNDEAKSRLSGAGDGLTAQKSAGKEIPLCQLAECQAQVAIMAAELTLHPQAEHYREVPGPKY